MTRSRFAALALALLAPLLALGQVTTDYTKTGIPNGTPIAITATTGTGSTMVLDTGATLSTPTLNTPTLSVPKYSTQTWANLPTAASNAWAVTVASDLGANGTLVASNGTRWRPVNGAATLKTVAAATSGINASETIVLQAQVPAGAWQTNDTIRIWLAATKSGTTDSGILSVRVGTAGTTADTAITTLSAYTLLAAAGVAGGSIFDIKLVSATSAQRLGTSSGASGTYQTSSGSGAAAAATTITDASANALFVTVTLKSSAANDTVGVQSGQIQLITP